MNETIAKKTRNFFQALKSILAVSGIAKRKLIHSQTIHPSPGRSPNNIPTKMKLPALNEYFILGIKASAANHKWNDKNENNSPIFCWILWQDE
jgi:hypothetical protein